MRRASSQTASAAGSWRRRCPAPASRPTSTPSRTTYSASSSRATWCSSWAPATSGRCPMSWRAEPNLAWLRSLPGVSEDHPLARHTSFNIGGPADFFLEATDVGPVLREARRREVPVRVIGAAAKRQMADWTAERRRTQPIETKNCGSVFKNPAGDSAGRLVEAVGLKGARQGGAVISPKHSNFIENLGGATAADVRALIERAQGAVAERFRITLETEVEFLGR